ncbi:MAG TPA: His/Gly/Thr/Pro-type tRNA ligase C-terminal domain-containing protein, partial [Gammaproteobacteria bacterium]|nr:His/Gly/Thr/Pro-type tRNA ligase C-terminal domain-containing protein [Gammaproteobacteria bacterium]
IGFKIREHTLQHVPYLLIVGDREVEANAVAVRTQAGENLGVMDLHVLTRKLIEEVARRGQVNSGGLKH